MAKKSACGAQHPFHGSQKSGSETAFGLAGSAFFDDFIFYFVLSLMTKSLRFQIFLGRENKQVTGHPIRKNRRFLPDFDQFQPKNRPKSAARIRLVTTAPHTHAPNSHPYPETRTRNPRP
jgi:hypothetical protein